MQEMYRNFLNSGPKFHIFQHVSPVTKYNIRFIKQWDSLLNFLEKENQATSESVDFIFREIENDLPAVL